MDDFDIRKQRWPIARSGASRSAAWDAPRLVAHLEGVLNAIPGAVFTFDSAMDLLFVSDRIATALQADGTVALRCKTVLELLESCGCFDQASVQQFHEAVLAAIAVADPVPPPLRLSSAETTQIFVIHLSRLAANQWMALCEDATERQAAESEAIKLAMRDPLTGLANRKLVADRLDALIPAQADGPASWMMLIDLDRFKAVNDTLGHPIGDALLKLVARRLVSALRSTDEIGRIGGDEFALVLPGYGDQDSVARIAKRLIDILGRPYLVNGHVIHIGASVGIAAAGEATSHEQMLRMADLALYAAKSAGRATFCFFDPEMDDRAHARRTLEIDLRKAIVLGEFELHFQPQVDLDRDAIVGFEALVRWRHPERGLVAPGDFIPLAEEIGLIVPIGEWVLREACREAARWPHELSVAVNVSANQFEHAEALVAAVAKALKASGLPGERLEIEITESVLLRHEDVVLAALHKIRALGVRIAMDDFGTGYSSLSQLNSFPFHKIKIDQSFVKVGDENNNAIIRAIAALGVSLGMATIAEGVETIEELACIRSNGCHSVQGYLFSKPVPIDQIDDVLAVFAARRALSNLQTA